MATGRRIQRALAAAAFCLATGAGAAAAADCAVEAARLSKAQSELPRLDAASPADRPPYCITLETIVAFINQLRQHVAHCPNSDHAALAGEWRPKQPEYSRLFKRHRCRPTLPR